MLCPRCTTENAEGADFCSSCGRAFIDRADVAEPALIWQADDGGRRSIPLTRTITLGRSSANDIAIHDSAVSRQHARIEVTDGEAYIIDLGSLNGTFVNDERVDDPVPLRDGDLLRIGRMVFTAVIPAPSELEEARTMALESPLAAERVEEGVAEEASEPTMFMATPSPFESAIPVASEEGLPSSTEAAELVGAEAEATPAEVGIEPEPPQLEAGGPPAELEAPPYTEEPEAEGLLAEWSEQTAGEEPGLEVESEAAFEAIGAEGRTISASWPMVVAEPEQPPDELTPPVTEEPAPAGYLVYGERRIPLYTSLSVGRAEGVDIRIEDDRTVSRFHARLEVRPDGVWLVDNNSANGTFLENERVTAPVRLQGDARIRFGATQFRFEPIRTVTLEPEAVAALSDETIVAPPAGGETQPLRVTRPAPDSSGTLEPVEAEDLTLRGEDLEVEPVPPSGVAAIPEGGGASPDQFRLIVNFGADVGSAFPLTKDVIVVGRASPEADYDIQLNDRAVSRPHAKLLRQADGFAIQDLESANGTWLNYTEEVTTLRPLSDGDIIKMGKTTLVYRVPTAIRPPTPEAVLDPNVGQILTVFSLKGGVGTTTLAVNLAVLLRRLTVRPVLLMDLATEKGAVSVHMNLTPRVTLADLPTDPALIDGEILQSLITHHSSGVDVLPAPPSPQTAELVSPAAVSSILPSLRSRYRWIIVDTSTTFSELNLGVLDQSDLLLLTFAPDLASLKVMQSTLDVLSALQTPAEKRVLVLNQIYPKPHLQPAEIEQTLGERIGLTLPHAEEVLLDTIDKGIPLAIDAPAHPTVAAIEAFASKLAQINVEAAKVPKRGGFGRWVQGIVSSLRR